MNIRLCLQKTYAKLRLLSKQVTNVIRIYKITGVKFCNFLLSVILDIGVFVPKLKKIVLLQVKIPDQFWYAIKKNTIFKYF